MKTLSKKLLSLLLSPRKTVVVEAEPEKIEKKKHHLIGKH